MAHGDIILGKDGKVCMTGDGKIVLGPRTFMLRVDGAMVSDWVRNLMGRISTKSYENVDTRKGARTDNYGEGGSVHVDYDNRSQSSFDLCPFPYASYSLAVSGSGTVEEPSGSYAFQVYAVPFPYGGSVRYDVPASRQSYGASISENAFISSSPTFSVVSGQAFRKDGNIFVAGPCTVRMSASVGLIITTRSDYDVTLTGTWSKSNHWETPPVDIWGHQMVSTISVYRYYKYRGVSSKYYSFTVDVKISSDGAGSLYVESTTPGQIADKTVGLPCKRWSGSGSYGFSVSANVGCSVRSPSFSLVEVV